MIKLRKAQISDCDLIYKWRNHPDVRKFFFDDREIDYSTHQEWFQNSLKMENRIILIAENDNQPVGVIRFDILKDNPDTAEIDIYVAPSFQGRGFGRQILVEGEKWIKSQANIRFLVAKVKETNYASKKIFENNEFDKLYIYYKKSIN